MASFGERLGVTAQRLTEKFSEEIGLSTFTYVTGEVYNADTGAYVPTTVQETAYVVFTQIGAGSGFSDLYRIDHGKAIVAGNDIARTPEDGTLITTPGSTTHRIVHVENDQYQDAFICHYEKKPA